MGKMAVNNEDLIFQTCDWIGKNDFLHLHFFRPLTMGEIGCFLSHYLIWEEVRGSILVFHFLTRVFGEVKGK